MLIWTVVDPWRHQTLVTWTDIKTDYDERFKAVSLFSFVTKEYRKWRQNVLQATDLWLARMLRKKFLRDVIRLSCERELLLLLVISTCQNGTVSKLLSYSCLVSAPLSAYLAEGLASFLSRPTNSERDFVCVCKQECWLKWSTDDPSCTVGKTRIMTSLHGLFVFLKPWRRTFWVARKTNNKRRPWWTDHLSIT